jgi:hypothetical protein
MGDVPIRFAGITPAHQSFWADGGFLLRFFEERIHGLSPPSSLWPGMNVMQSNFLLSANPRRVLKSLLSCDI